MRMNAYCQRCLRDKRLNAFPRDAAPERVEAYRQRVTELIRSGTHLCTPEVDYAIGQVYRELFGAPRDFSAINHHFNALMLDLEPDLAANVARAADPLARAVQYAMMGNFIDFAALDNVEEGKLRALLDGAADVPVDAGMLSALREEVTGARSLAFFTDNCGEIVADKVLLRALRALNPGMSVTVVVRGEPTGNDATLADAAQVGLDTVADRVIGNGTGIPGNPMGRISPEAGAVARSADVLIAKGQANYESMSGCGLNVFYIFMCKCALFMDRFRVPQYSGILTREGAVRFD